MNLHRLLEARLVSELDRPTATILLGPRQVGKSFLLRRLEEIAQQQGKRTTFFDLERPEHLRQLSGSDEELLGLLQSSGDVVFLDEFQYLKNATKLLKILSDSRSGPKVLASGSSSIEIHKHLKESLSGRFRAFLVHPLEWMGEYDQLRQASWPDYLRFGGLPGLLHETSDADRMELLSNLVSTYLLKDIRALIQEENVRAFNALLYMLAQNQGSLVSTASLAREIRLSEPTLARYLDILHQTYTVFPLGSFSRNLANELKKSRKYYLYDLGIRNMLVKDFSLLASRPDKGILAESVVEASLRRRLQPNETLHFWRTKQGDEVDFVLCRDRTPVPIEVKVSFHGSQDFRSLHKFLDAYPDAPAAYLLTLEDRSPESDPAEYSYSGRTISVQSCQSAATMEFFAS
jgi:hypothetical protein